MTTSLESRRTVFRRIALRPHTDWPVFDSTPLYDRTSLAGLESDVRSVSTYWFRHDAHTSVERFICSLPLAYFRFEAHDQYTSSTRYEMDTLFRVFVLKNLHGWEHETALIEYLESRSERCDQLGLETVPDQSTLWRSWHNRFTADLREIVEIAARTILVKAHEMYRQAVNRLLDEVAETEKFFRAGIVAIDITEAEPFTGDRTGHEDEIIGTKEKTDEYAYQWATAQLVGNAVPIVLDARPVRKGESRLEIVEDLLDSAEEMVHVDNVLMDREFDSQHILEMIRQRGLSYVVPKRMQTSEKAQAKRLLQRGQDRYETDRKLHLGKNEWHGTTLIYRRKENAEHDDHRQYSVFMSNRGSGHLTEYGYRWKIESGYKSIKRFMAATTSNDFGLRFFYFAFACLLYSIWRAVDLLVQVELTGEYVHSPIVTADNTLTLLKKETGIG
jgi:hypothetical protein